MIRHLYTAIYSCSIPLLLLRALWRSYRHDLAYRQRWAERFGFSPIPSTPIDYCIHAVSLGEAIVAQRLVTALFEADPTATIALTTTTISGSRYVREHIDKRIVHTYLPFDVPFALHRFITRLQPARFIIMETELWPNLLYVLKQHHIPVLLANARLSEKSAKGYQRLPLFAASMLSYISCVCAQSDSDAARFIRIGLDKTTLLTTGNIKYDMTLEPELIAHCLLYTSPSPRDS